MSDPYLQSLDTSLSWRRRERRTVGVIADRMGWPNLDLQTVKRANPDVQGVRHIVVC